MNTKIMTTWHSLDLGDGVEAFEPTRKIQQAYIALEVAAKPPPDCAVFSYYDLQRNVVTAYFSPSASQLALAFGAKPCSKPENRDGFGLLVGDLRVWSILFGT